MTFKQEQEGARSSQGQTSQAETRKPYTKPKILHELALETRAGTPLVVDPLDPLGLEPKK
jgi:hypothetical protein